MRYESILPWLRDNFMEVVVVAAAAFLIFTLGISVWQLLKDRRKDPPKWTGHGW